MRPVLIAGPTASGKSALALAVAERDGGVVINADALQVYNRWRVLTARPSAAETSRAPHALYGHVGMRTRYSVGRWLREVDREIAEARRGGRRAVVVGGTGLYLSALTQGLAAIPPVPDDVRSRCEAMVAGGRLAALRDELARRDPETHAEIDTRNPARVRRAWEVLEATGRGLAAWRRGAAPPLVAPDAAVLVVVSREKGEINTLICKRFHEMLHAGALAECRAALAAGWDPALPSAKALGAAELVAYLRGAMSLDAATAAAVVATQRFAKRQRTWFRGRMRDWTWLSPDGRGAAGLVDAVPRG